MTKISKKAAYPVKIPVSKDYFVGTDSENYGKTVNFDFEATAKLINNLNGSPVLNYIFRTDSNIDLTVLSGGVFLSSENKTAVSTLTKLYINKNNFHEKDMSALFRFIASNRESFVMKLRNSSNLSNAVYFKITGATEYESHFTLDVAIHINNTAVPQLINFNVYFFDFELSSSSLAITLPEFNKIVTQTGFSLTGQSLIINALWEWVFLNMTYSNPLAVTKNIPYCATGLKRIDYVVPNKFNSFDVISGQETSGILVAPQLPNNGIYVTYFIVTDSAIGDASTPIIGENYIAKASKSFIRMFNTGNVDVISIDDKSWLKFEQGMTSLKSINIPDPKNFYFGKSYIIKNGATHNVTLFHNLGTGGFKFNFPNAQDIILKPEESVQFILRAINYTNTGGLLDYVGLIKNQISDIEGLVTSLDAKSDKLTTYNKSEVDAKINSRFKGVYLTQAALISAHPIASIGDYAQVNEVGATDVVNYNWDAEENIWVKNAVVGSSATNTDQLPEGSSNLYFNTARVLAGFLTGILFVTGGSIVSTDSVLVAFGKLQKQINDLVSGKQNKLVAGANIAIDNTNPLAPVISTTSFLLSAMATKTDLNKVSSINGFSPLVTPTSDGSGEAVHPSVLYFKNKWNGYRYWMAMTPYFQYNDKLENPEILVSNNGIDWIVPAGLTNPIEPSPAGAGNYNSDTELVYDYDKNVLWCVIRCTINGIQSIKAQSSLNGISWTAASTILTSTTDYLLSPAIIYENGLFTMFWVGANIPDVGARVLRYKTSNNMLSGWSATTNCTATFPTGRDLWHMSMRKINEEYHGFFHCGDPGSSTSNVELYFAVSTDNLNYTVKQTPILRSGIPNNFDFSNAYRGSAVYMPEKNKYAYWYSAVKGVPSTGNWRIGYTEIDLDTEKKENFYDITTSRDIHASHNNSILKIKANVTLNIPLDKLQEDFVCYFDVYPTFTLTISSTTGNTITGNSGLSLTANKMAMLHREALTNNYRLRGDI